MTKPKSKTVAPKKPNTPKLATPKVVKAAKPTAEAKSKEAKPTKAAKPRTPKKQKPTQPVLGARTLSPANAWPYTNPASDVPKKEQPMFRFLPEQKNSNEISLPGFKDTRVVCRTSVVPDQDLLTTTVITQEMTTKRVKFGKLPLMSHFLTHDKNRLVTLAIKVGKTSALQYLGTEDSFRKVVLRKSLQTTPVNASLRVMAARLIPAGASDPEYSEIAN